MTSKKEIEAILKINGVSPASSDAEIKSVLLSARYNEEEVEAAMIVLKESPGAKEKKLTGLHKVFRTDSTLDCKEISNLLGIEIDENNTITTTSKERRLSKPQVVSVCILSVMFAFGGVLTWMYLLEIGMFHPSLN